MSRKTQDLGRVSRPFSIGYAYAQTQHYRDAVGAQQADPFDALPAEEELAPAAPVRAQGQFQDPATPAQVRYAMSLATRKLGLTTAEELESAERTFKAMGKREISHRIDAMKAAPDAPRVTPATAPAATVTEGMYRDPATGDIYKVQVAHHGSGNLYAKKLVALDTPKVKGKKTYSHEFVYIPGAIRLIQAAWKMSKEQAQEWGRLYGACCKCGAILTDERSIANGIGPVCGGSW